MRLMGFMDFQSHMKRARSWTGSSAVERQAPRQDQCIRIGYEVSEINVKKRECLSSSSSGGNIAHRHKCHPAHPGNGTSNMAPKFGMMNPGGELGKRKLAAHWTGKLG